MNMKFSVRKLVLAAIVGAVYAALTMALAPISYGPIQFRISEVLCILPFFFPFSVWGLFVGCILANLISAYGILDIVFGSLATLLAGLCTMAIGKMGRERIINKVLACLPPVIFNGLIVGAVLAYTYTPDAFWAGLALNGGEVALGELVVLYVIGLPLLIFLPKSNTFKKFKVQYTL
jgi:uncharacterized membrane protein